MFCKTLSQELFLMDPNIYESKEVSLYNKLNNIILCVIGNILYVANPEIRVNHHKTDSKMTYLKKKNINEPIRHKLRNKYVYETKIHNIYNLILGKTNDKLWEKAGNQTYLVGGHDRLIPYRVFDDIQEALFKKQISKTPHPVSITDEQATFQHNPVHK